MGDRPLVLLSQTMGNLGQVVARFEACLAFCQRAGYRFELDRACSGDTGTLQQRNQSGGRKEAMSLPDESLAISSGPGDASPDGAGAVWEGHPEGLAAHNLEKYE